MGKRGGIVRVGDQHGAAEQCGRAEACEEVLPTLEYAREVHTTLVYDLAEPCQVSALQEAFT